MLKMSFKRLFINFCNRIIKRIRIINTLFKCSLTWTLILFFLCHNFVTFYYTTYFSILLFPLKYFSSVVGHILLSEILFDLLSCFIPEFWLINSEKLRLLKDPTEINECGWPRHTVVSFSVLKANSFWSAR